MSYRDVKQLVSMGFDEAASRRALRKANNSVHDAIRILQEEMEEIPQSNPTRRSSARKQNPPKYRDIQKLVSMGYDEDSATQALDESNGDIDEAIQILNDMYNENYNEPNDYNEVVYREQNDYDDQYQNRKSHHKSHHKRKSHHDDESSSDDKKSCVSLVLLFFAPTLIVLLILFIYDSWNDKY